MDHLQIIASVDQDLNSIATEYRAVQRIDEQATIVYCQKLSKLAQSVSEKTCHQYELYLLILCKIMDQLRQIYVTLAPTIARLEMCQQLFVLCTKAILGIQWKQLAEDNPGKTGMRIVLGATHSMLSAAGYTRIQLLLDLMDTHWDNPVLSQIMSNDCDNEEEGKAYIVGEDPMVLKLRVELLLAEDCEEFVLNLCHWCTYHPMLKDDIYLRQTQLLLLHKHNHVAKFREECQKISCHFGVQIVRSLEQMEQHKGVCVLLSQTFLIQDWINPNTYCCTNDLLRLWIKHQYLSDKDVEKFSDSVWSIAKLSRNTMQLGMLIEALRKEVGLDKFLQLFTDLAIYALNLDKGLWECAKSFGDDGAKQMSEKAIARTCVQINSLYQGLNLQVQQRSIITAFALEPTQENFSEIVKIYEQKFQQSPPKPKVDVPTSGANSNLSSLNVDSLRKALPNCAEASKTAVNQSGPSTGSASSSKNSAVVITAGSKMQMQVDMGSARILEKDKNKGGSINPATLYEMDRLLKLFRPWFFNPLLPWKDLCIVATDYIAHKKALSPEVEAKIRDKINTIEDEHGKSCDTVQTEQGTIVGRDQFLAQALELQKAAFKKRGRGRPPLKKPERLETDNKEVQKSSNSLEIMYKTVYKCLICGTLYDDVQQLKEHVRSICRPEGVDADKGSESENSPKQASSCPLFKCRLCSAVKSSLQEFELHLATCHAAECDGTGGNIKICHVYRCKYCKKFFSRREDLQNHWNVCVVKLQKIAKGEISAKSHDSPGSTPSSCSLNTDETIPANQNLKGNNQVGIVEVTVQGEQVDLSRTDTPVIKKKRGRKKKIDTIIGIKEEDNRESQSTPSESDEKQPKKRGRKRKNFAKEEESAVESTETDSERTEGRKVFPRKVKDVAKENSATRELIEKLLKSKDDVISDNLKGGKGKVKPKTDKMCENSTQELIEKLLKSKDDVISDNNSKAGEAMVEPKTEKMCEICAEKFTNLKPLIEHYAITHIRPYKFFTNRKNALMCFYCRKFFDTFFKYASHIQEHEEVLLNAVKAFKNSHPGVTPVQRSKRLEDSDSDSSDDIIAKPKLKLLLPREESTDSSIELNIIPTAKDSRASVDTQAKDVSVSGKPPNILLSKSLERKDSLLSVSTESSSVEIDLDIDQPNIEILRKDNPDNSTLDMSKDLRCENDQSRQGSSLCPQKSTEESSLSSDEENTCSEYDPSTRPSSTTDLSTVVSVTEESTADELVKMESVDEEFMQFRTAPKVPDQFELNRSENDVSGSCFLKVEMTPIPSDWNDCVNSCFQKGSEEHSLNIRSPGNPKAVFPTAIASMDNKQNIPPAIDTAGCEEVTTGCCFEGSAQPVAKTMSSNIPNEQNCVDMSGNRRRSFVDEFASKISMSEARETVKTDIEIPKSLELENKQTSDPFPDCGHEGNLVLSESDMAAAALCPHCGQLVPAEPSSSPDSPSAETVSVLLGSETIPEWNKMFKKQLSVSISANEQALCTLAAQKLSSEAKTKCRNTRSSSLDTESKPMEGPSLGQRCRRSSTQALECKAKVDSTSKQIFEEQTNAKNNNCKKIVRQTVRGPSITVPQKSDPKLKLLRLNSKERVTPAVKTEVIIDTVDISGICALFASDETAEKPVNSQFEEESPEYPKVMGSSSVVPAVDYLGMKYSQNDGYKDNQDCIRNQDCIQSEDDGSREGANCSGTDQTAAVCKIENISIVSIQKDSTADTVKDITDSETLENVGPNVQGENECENNTSAEILTEGNIKLEGGQVLLIPVFQIQTLDSQTEANRNDVLPVPAEDTPGTAVRIDPLPVEQSLIVDTSAVDSGVGTVSAQDSKIGSVSAQTHEMSTAASSGSKVKEDNEKFALHHCVAGSDGKNSSEDQVAHKAENSCVVLETGEAVENNIENKIRLEAETPEKPDSNLPIINVDQQDKCVIEDPLTNVLVEERIKNSSADDSRESTKIGVPDQTTLVSKPEDASFVSIQKVFSASIQEPSMPPAVLKPVDDLEQITVQPKEIDNGVTIDSDTPIGNDSSSVGIVERSNVEILEGKTECQPQEEELEAVNPGTTAAEVCPSPHRSATQTDIPSQYERLSPAVEDPHLPVYAPDEGRSIKTSLEALSQVTVTNTSESSVSSSSNAKQESQVQETIPETQSSCTTKEDRDCMNSSDCVSLNATECSPSNSEDKGNLSVEIKTEESELDSVAEECPHVVYDTSHQDSVILTKENDITNNLTDNESKFSCLDVKKSTLKDGQQTASTSLKTVGGDVNFVQTEETLPPSMGQMATCIKELENSDRVQSECPLSDEEGIKNTILRQPLKDEHVDSETPVMSFQESSNTTSDCLPRVLNTDGFPKEIIPSENACHSESLASTCSPGTEDHSGLIKKSHTHKEMITSEDASHSESLVASTCSPGTEGHTDLKTSQKQEEMITSEDAPHSESRGTTCIPGTESHRVQNTTHTPQCSAHPDSAEGNTPVDSPTSDRINLKEDSEDVQTFESTTPSSVVHDFDSTETDVDCASKVENIRVVEDEHCVSVTDVSFDSNFLPDKESQMSRQVKRPDAQDDGEVSFSGDEATRIPDKETNVSGDQEPVHEYNAGHTEKEVDSGHNGAEISKLNPVQSSSDEITNSNIVKDQSSQERSDGPDRTDNETKVVVKSPDEIADGSSRMSSRQSTISQVNFTSSGGLDLTTVSVKAETSVGASSNTALQSDMDIWSADVDETEDTFGEVNQSGDVDDSTKTLEEDHSEETVNSPSTSNRSVEDGGIPQDEPSGDRKRGRPRKETISSKSSSRMKTRQTSASDPHSQTRPQRKRTRTSAGNDDYIYLFPGRRSKQRLKEASVQVKRDQSRKTVRTRRPSQTVNLPLTRLRVTRAASSSSHSCLQNRSSNARRNDPKMQCGKQIANAANVNVRSTRRSEFRQTFPTTKVEKRRIGRLTENRNTKLFGEKVLRSGRRTFEIPKDEVESSKEVHEMHGQSRTRSIRSASQPKIVGTENSNVEEDRSCNSDFKEDGNLIETCNSSSVSESGENQRSETGLDLQAASAETVCDADGADIVEAAGENVCIPNCPGSGCGSCENTYQDGTSEENHCVGQTDFREDGKAEDSILKHSPDTSIPEAHKLDNSGDEKLSNIVRNNCEKLSEDPKTFPVNCDDKHDVEVETVPEYTEQCPTVRNSKTEEKITNDGMQDKAQSADNNTKGNDRKRSDISSVTDLCSKPTNTKQPKIGEGNIYRIQRCAGTQTNANARNENMKMRDGSAEIDPERKANFVRMGRTMSLKSRLLPKSSKPFTWDMDDNGDLISETKRNDGSQPEEGILMTLRKSLRSKNFEAIHREKNFEVLRRGATHKAAAREGNGAGRPQVGTSASNADTTRSASRNNDARVFEVINKPASRRAHNLQQTNSDGYGTRSRPNTEAGVSSLGTPVSHAGDATTVQMKGVKRKVESGTLTDIKYTRLSELPEKEQDYVPSERNNRRNSSVTRGQKGSQVTNYIVSFPGGSKSVVCPTNTPQSVIIQRVCNTKDANLKEPANRQHTKSPSALARNQGEDCANSDSGSSSGDHTPLQKWKMQRKSGRQGFAVSFTKARTH